MASTQTEEALKEKNVNRHKVSNKEYDKDKEVKEIRNVSGNTSKREENLKETENQDVNKISIE